MTFKIIENFLPTDYAYEIQHYATSGDIPWSFNWSASSEDDDCGHGYFSHRALKLNTSDARNNTPMYYNGQTMSLLSHFLSKQGIDYIRMIKFNMYARTQEIIQHGKHFDRLKFRQDMPWSEKSEKTILYYVNDNDGYTEYFPDGKDPIKVLSKFNTALYTDEHILHRSSTCTDKPARITMNINFR